MRKNPEKQEKIDEMIKVFSNILTALTMLRDQDVSETEVLHDLGINKNTFRRVVYDLNWTEVAAEDRGSFRDKFKDNVPTRHWTEDLFCDVMGIKRNPAAISKIPSDVVETMKDVIKECLIDQEKRVVVYMYRDGMTQEEVSKKLNVSDTRVMQIRQRAFQKMRTRGRRYYILYGKEYYFSQKELAKRVEDDLYVERAQKELNRLNDLIAYKKSILDNMPLPPKQLRLEDLDLSVRAFNCLKRAGIKTLEDICACTESEIRNVRNLGGGKAFEEVVNAVYSRGMHFREE